MLLAASLITTWLGFRSFRCSDLDWRWLGGVSTRGRIAGAVRVTARSPIGFDVSCPVGMPSVSAVRVAPTLRSLADRAARRRWALKRQSMNRIEALVHQRVTLSLFADHFLKLHPETGPNNKVSHRNLRERRNNEFAELAPWLSNRSHCRARCVIAR